MRTKLNAMRAIPGLVAMMLATACGSTATNEPGTPPGGEPPDSPATKPGTASSRIVQVGSTTMKGCKGTAVFDLIGAETIDAVKIEAMGTRDLATELYTVDAKGKETRLAKRARSMASTEDAASSKESGDEATSSRLAIAPGEPNPSAPDDTIGDEEPDADGDDDTASAEAALTASEAGAGSGEDGAAKLATAVAKSVSDMASKGLAMPGSATSGGGAAGLGSSSGPFPGQSDLIAAIEKEAADGRTASQQAFDDIHKQALDHAEGVKQRIADAQAGKGLGPIDMPGAEEQPGGSNEQPGGPSSGGTTGEPASGSGSGQPATGGGATAGGEPTTGGGATTGGGTTTGGGATTGGGTTTGGTEGGVTSGGVARGPVAYRGGKGVKSSPKQQGRMYDKLHSLGSKHFRLHVTFQATKAKPTLRLVESAAKNEVLAERSFSSAFPTTCK
jgi:hypothetical protein